MARKRWHQLGFKPQIKSKVEMVPEQLWMRLGQVYYAVKRDFKEQ